MISDDITSSELITDYKRIQEIEEEYFKLIKKYDPDATCESDAVTVDILLTLGKRVAEESN